MLPDLIGGWPQRSRFATAFGSQNASTMDFGSAASRQRCRESRQIQPLNTPAACWHTGFCVEPHESAPQTAHSAVVMKRSLS